MRISPLSFFSFSSPPPSANVVYLPTYARLAHFTLYTICAV